MKNIIHIKEMYPQVYNNIHINATISPGIELSCINNFFKADDVVNSIPLIMNTLKEIGTKDKIEYNDEFIIANRFEKMKVILYAIGNKDILDLSKIFISEFERDMQIKEQLISHFDANEAAHHSGPCIPGLQRLLIDVNGNFFPCERVSETSECMNIGNLNNGFDLDKIASLINIGKVTEDECLNCWNFYYCNICVSLTEYNGNISKSQKLRYCNSMRESTLEKMKLYCLFKEQDINLKEKLLWPITN
jgi:uncharacterized protein